MKLDVLHCLLLLSPTVPQPSFFPCLSSIALVSHSDSPRPFLAVNLVGYSTTNTIAASSSNHFRPYKRLFPSKNTPNYQVQGIFLRSPGYDLRGLLGGADTSLRGIIELAEPSRGRGRMLASGVETVWMDPAIRSRVARALQLAQAASATSGALYAIWVCGEKLVSLAQPRAPSHRLTSRDLLLLVNFVATQPALRTAESWTPVCFPRFQETVSLTGWNLTVVCVCVCAG